MSKSLHVIPQPFCWHPSTHDCYFCDLQVKKWHFFPSTKGNLVRRPASHAQLQSCNISHVCSLPSGATCCIYAPDGPGINFTHLNLWLGWRWRLWQARLLLAPSGSRRTWDAGRRQPATAHWWHHHHACVSAAFSPARGCFQSSAVWRRLLTMRALAGGSSERDGS